MSRQYPNKSPRPILIAVLLLLAVGLLVRPVRGEDVTDDPKTAAVAAMQTWLKEIDQNQYAQSWTDASDSFQKAITSDRWTAALNAARTPLGKCTSRQLASALHQTGVPTPNGELLKGDYVIAQFNSSFENLAYAVETVTFEKAPDGTWKAAGYYVKPKI